MLGLAGKVMHPAKDAKGLDEELLVVELAGDFDCQLTKVPRQPDVKIDSYMRHGDQGRTEQPGLGAGFRPLERRHDEFDRILVSCSHPPVTSERDGEAENLGCPISFGSGVFHGAPQIGLIGIQDTEPPALFRSGEVRSGQLGNRKEMCAVRRPDSRGRGLTRLDEAFQAELTNGFK